jgi:hypothetical protein
MTFPIPKELADKILSVPGRPGREVWEIPFEEWCVLDNCEEKNRVINKNWRSSPVASTPPLHN